VRSWRFVPGSVATEPRARSGARGPRERACRGVSGAKPLRRKLASVAISRPAGRFDNDVADSQTSASWL
jgi:hypothetical protein